MLFQTSRSHVFINQQPVLILTVVANELDKVWMTELPKIVDLCLKPNAVNSWQFFCIMSNCPGIAQKFWYLTWNILTADYGDWSFHIFQRIYNFPYKTGGLVCIFSVIKISSQYCHHASYSDINSQYYHVPTKTDFSIQSIRQCTGHWIIDIFFLKLFISYTIYITFDCHIWVYN